MYFLKNEVNAAMLPIIIDFSGAIFHDKSRPPGGSKSKICIIVVLFLTVIHFLALSPRP